MSGTYHYGDSYGGDRVEVSGSGIGKIVQHGPVDQQAAFRDLLEAVQALRAQVSDPDRQVIDESLATLQAPRPEPAKLRRALGAVSGVALMVGQVGAPVAEAVRKVMTALGV
ncbi:hypothetical protein VA596_06860 [Amycolatopsis sp., V23-08]|uniref:Uncharacterized protein n=1 Tax=Amycolatopsis heterodermiae TaxID=3110235 RepID=A0ABU5R056_9PSEU|nr:hypothetical protein [Amycolatopsis sp., V23-08]MEA5359249.1 hypothetical protein [Amycolatopsis sp., V23-08]